MSLRRNIGRYHLRDFLGRGAVGDVHRAYDPQLDRQVALKWIRKAGADPEALAAERHGAELQKQVASIAPQVASVYEYGDVDDIFYISMELIEGRDLSRVLEEDAANGILPFSRTVALTSELCDLIETFHHFSTQVGGRRISGIVHGDIKPDNVRIQSDGRLRMLDFGIAKHLGQSKEATRNLFGSLPYAPPERLRTGMVDAGSDLWAVGILLYSLASGQRPYTPTDHAALEQAIRTEPPESLPEEIPAPLRRVVEKATAFDPAARYESAADLRAALEEAASEVSDDYGLALTRPSAEDGPTDESTRRTIDESTRRTVTPSAGATAPSAGASGPTRRTEAAATTPPPLPVHAASPPVPPPLPASTPTTRTQPARRAPRRKRWLLIAASVFLFSQVQAQMAASAIVDNLGSSAEPNVQREWRRFQSVAWLRPFDLGLWKAKRSLRSALLTDAERTIAGFRTDIPSLEVDDWKDARDSIEAALDIRSGEADELARLLYVQAHIDRLEGRRLRRKGDREQARESVVRATFGFERAAELDEEWADPYLGLARIHAYEDFDLERLIANLRGALSRGYSWGKRERAQLADAHHTRANQLVMHAGDIERAAGEGPLLREARTHLERAIAGYEQILDFGNARTNRDTARKRLAQVREKLRQTGRRQGIEWS
ncbi:MAG: protein kinase [Acidobacteriota bacterium]